MISENDYIPTTIQESRVEQSLIEKFSRKASEIIGEDNVSSGQADLLSTCRDFWPVNNIWMLEGSMPALPQLVVWPRSTNEASALLKLANELKVAVIPYGEGSGTVGGLISSFSVRRALLKFWQSPADLSPVNLSVGEILKRACIPTVKVYIIKEKMKDSMRV